MDRIIGFSIAFRRLWGGLGEEVGDGRHPILKEWEVVPTSLFPVPF